MPIYEYKCENGHVFDVIQKMTDEALDKCEECGAPAARMLSAPAIHFKGSGFHNTDYGTKRRPVSEDGGSPGTSDGASSNGSGGDGAVTKSADSGSSGSSGDSGKSSGGGKSVGLDKV
ncbi:MAG TPA: FmdB family zinc ribbon protein [Solirubrobacterales bacterium]